MMVIGSGIWKQNERDLPPGLELDMNGKVLGRTERNHRDLGTSSAVARDATVGSSLIFDDDICFFNPPPNPTPNGVLFEVPVAALRKTVPLPGFQG